jgi:hypothetical protein
MGTAPCHFDVDTANGQKGVFLVLIWADGQDMAQKVIVE